MSKLHPVRGEGPHEEAPVAAERVTEASPRTVTALDYEQGGKTFAGEWSATEGAWRVQYDEWEFCHVLEGACELVPDGEPAQRFQAGDSFVIEPGFTGIWRVLQPMKKRFVVRHN